MLTEFAVLAGLVGVFVGLLEISHRLEETPPGPLSSEAAVREAMRGPEGNAVQAEFRRHGIIAGRADRRPFGFGV